MQLNCITFPSTLNQGVVLSASALSVISQIIKLQQPLDFIIIVNTVTFNFQTCNAYNGGEQLLEADV